MLRKYAGTEAAKAEESKTAKTNIAFLAVLNCFGAIGFLVLAVLVLVLSNMLSAMANVLPLAALGTLFAGILIGFGFFDLISGIGLIMRTFWGWWLCIVGLGWSIFDRGSGVAIRFMHAPDWTVEIAPAIGEMLVMFSAFYFLSFMCKKNTMKMFKVDVHAGIAWTVALSFGLILGGVGFGIAISAIRSLQSTP